MQRVIVTVLVVAFFVGMAFACSELGDDPNASKDAVTAEDSAAAEARRAAGEAVQMEADTSAGRWTLTTGTSPLDDSPSVDLSVREEWVRPGGPDPASSAVLHVRCLEDRTRVLVQTPDRFSPPNQPERLRVYDVPVRIRIDQLPVRAETWRESDDATAISAPRAIALARQMAGKRRMRVEYVTHDRGARVVTFPIHGLEQRLGEVARACNWRF